MVQLGMRKNERNDKKNGNKIVTEEGIQVNNMTNNDNK
jgi:hypothetical protein